MAKIVQSYRDLVVWNKAMQLVTEIYRVSQNFPKEELFGLMSQIRRAAVSVPSNIAEGHGKLSRKEYQHFLGHARGSLAEVETQMTIAQNLGYLNAEVVSRILDLSAEVGRILNGLLASLKSKE
ncbi:MAG TPA: four helix bundle protein [Desulfobaccales bacterium]